MVVDLVKNLINTVKQLIVKHNYVYNIFIIEEEYKLLLTNDTTKKKHLLSIILYLLMDLHINNFANRSWLIPSHQAAILKRSSLYNTTRTDKQNISLSDHKGLLQN